MRKKNNPKPNKLPTPVPESIFLRSAITKFAKDFEVPEKLDDSGIPGESLGEGEEDILLPTQEEPCGTLVMRSLQIRPDPLSNEEEPTAEVRLREMHEKWETSGQDVSHGILDWRAAIAKPVREGNIEGVKQAGVMSAQVKVLELANEADSEAIQLQAAQLILSQSGHGPIMKTENRVEYERIPRDQLLAVIQAKFTALRRLNPDFDPRVLFKSGDIIEVEAEPEKT